MEISRNTLQQSLPVRVGDLEREACVVSLIGHHLQGRLSNEDLERRQRSAMAAGTADDIRLLLMDLPELEAATTPPHGQRPPTLPTVRIPKAVHALLPAVPLLGVAGLGTAAWQYSAEGHYYTALLAGAVGYATHAVTTRLRR